MTSKKLKTGFTTGTAAAAATKGALILLCTGKSPQHIRIPFLSKGHVDIKPERSWLENDRQAVCEVIKDGGDDPDVTHRAVIGARVTLIPKDNHKGRQDVVITGGKGVGVVTRPGLEVPMGQPAINPGPQKMIQQAVASALKDCNPKLSVQVEIYVPQGEKIAGKTLNARLGILGGISILGTTGIERPMSCEAYVATIRSAISVARACGIKTIVMTTGRRSERYAMALWPEFEQPAFVQIGDFFKTSLQQAAGAGFDSVILAVFFGKALKMAMGAEHTHASSARLTLDRLADWSLELTSDQTLYQNILDANTARHAFEILIDRHKPVIDHVGRQMVLTAKRFIPARMSIQAIIFDFSGQPVFDSSLNNSTIAEKQT